MMYRTHKAGGTLGMLVAFEVMKTQGLLLPDVNSFIQLAMMYPASSWGATVPDLDHHLGSVKEHTPFNLFVHKILHLTHPTHRSWQTHSLYVTVPICLLLLALVYLGNSFFDTVGAIEWIYVRMVIIGANIGVFSHLLLDALSTGGIWVIPGVKLRFVPKSSAFATGGLWETVVFYILMIFITLGIVDIVATQYGIDLLSLLKSKI